MTLEIADWNGQPMQVVRSRGGGAIAAYDYTRNMIQTPFTPWPSAEVLQKLCASTRSGAFHPEDYSALAAKLGFYSDLQSLNSEDAMTWSYFGPIVHTTPEVRAHFMMSLLSKIGVADHSGLASAWLWRRVVHPDKPITMGGPEIDFGLQSGSAVILGEAKWRSKVGKGQGVNRDKDQIQLRREVLEKFGRAFFPSARTLVVLGVGIEDDVACESTAVLDSGARVIVCNLPWKALCSFDAHPLRPEVAAYYDWKYKWTHCPPALHSLAPAFAAPPKTLPI
jgi:hypothetical protein